MSETERLLRTGSVHFTPMHPADPIARRCVAQYFSELSRRFEHGFDAAQSIPVDDDQLLPPRGVFLVGTLDGEAVACGCIKTVAPGVGYLKRMWVAESARGMGLGRRTLQELEAAARTLGFTRLCLETNRALTEAIALYRSSGYREVEPFNAEPYAHHWFEKNIEPSRRPPARPVDRTGRRFRTS